MKLLQAAQPEPHESICFCAQGTAKYRVCSVCVEDLSQESNQCIKSSWLFSSPIPRRNYVCTHAFAAQNAISSSLETGNQPKWLHRIGEPAFYSDLKAKATSYK